MDALRTLLNSRSIELAFVLGWVVLLLPALIYLWKKWPCRRDLLLQRLSPAAIELYYKQFFPLIAVPKHHAALQDMFRKEFEKQYGRRH